MSASSIVSFPPPDDWRVDSIGDRHAIVGDCCLTELGRTDKARHSFKIKRKPPASPNRSKSLQHVNEIQDKHIVTLEEDYGRKSTTTVCA